MKPLTRRQRASDSHAADEWNRRDELNRRLSKFEVRTKALKTSRHITLDILLTHARLVCRSLFTFLFHPPPLSVYFLLPRDRPLSVLD